MLVKCLFLKKIATGVGQYTTENRNEQLSGVLTSGKILKISSGSVS